MSKVKVTTEKTGFSMDISGIAELICDTFTRKTCLVSRSKVKVNFGGLRAVCLEKYIFAVVSTDKKRRAVPLPLYS